MSKVAKARKRILECYSENVLDWSAPALEDIETILSELDRLTDRYETAPELPEGAIWAKGSFYGSSWHIVLSESHQSLCKRVYSMSFPGWTWRQRWLVPSRLPKRRCPRCTECLRKLSQ
jgi:hypothetical protein